MLVNVDDRLAGIRASVLPGYVTEDVPAILERVIKNGESADWCFHFSFLL